MLEVSESQFGYAGRTKENAQEAWMTIAIAVDYSTAGEKVTKRVSKRYLHFNLQWTPEQWQQELEDFFERNPPPPPNYTLNVAGNGMYTWSRWGFTQAQVNDIVAEALTALCVMHPPGKIISGGQTGADWAGLVFAGKRNIPCKGHWPKGFVMRYSYKGEVKDRTHTEFQIRGKFAKDIA